MIVHIARNPPVHHRDDHVCDQLLRLDFELAVEEQVAEFGRIESHRRLDRPGIGSELARIHDLQGVLPYQI